MVVLVSCLPKKTDTVNENHNEVEGGLVIGKMSVSQRAAAEDLTQKSEGNAEVFVENGVVHSVLTDAGGTSSLNEEQTISKFFSDNAKLYLIDDFNSSFVLKDNFQNEDGSQVFSYQQVHDGVPVYLANIRVSLNEAGAVSLVNSNYLPRANLFKSTTPKMDLIAAREAFSKKGYDVLESSKPELVIFSPSMINETGMPFLAWHAKAAGEDLFGSVLINDSDGSLVSTSTDIKTFNFEIRDFGSKVREPVDNFVVETFEQQRSLNGNNLGDRQRVKHLQEYLNKIQDYYSTKFNYQKFNKIDSFVRIGVNFKLKGENGIIGPFTTRFDSTSGKDQRIIAFDEEANERPIDVLAHEFQHIVTSDFVKLENNINHPESSALDEALSDFFAAVMDYDGDPWIMGSSNDVIRDIQDPSGGKSKRAQPKHNRAFYVPQKGESGYGYGNGHHNSTIISHAFYLLTEGGQGSGTISEKINVLGIGIDKTAQVVFHSLSKLNTNATFAQARNAMIESCNALAFKNIVTFTDCNQVRNAFAAVGIGRPERVVKPSVSSVSKIFGMGSNTHMRTESIETAYKEMADLGVQFVREDIPWQEIHVGNNEFNYGYRDGKLQKALTAARENNLEVVGILAYGPGEKVVYSNRKEFIALWDEYVERVVYRFGDYIDYWEIGNEVSTWWWKVRPEDKSFQAATYVEMLHNAYKIIKAADPNDVVIMSSVPNIDRKEQGLDPFTFLQRMGDFKIYALCDAIALHLYWPGQDPDKKINTLVLGREFQLNMAEYVRRFADEAENRLGKRHPIWITEVGYDLNQIGQLPSRFQMSANEVQSVMMLKSYFTLMSNPDVKSVFWYTWFDDSASGKFKISDQSKKAYKTMSIALTNAKSIGAFDVLDKNNKTTDKAVEYRFERGDGRIVSYSWTTDPAQALMPQEVRYNELGENSGRINDLYGELDQSQARQINLVEGFTITSIPTMIMGRIDRRSHIIFKDAESTDYGKAPIVTVWSYTKDTFEYFYLTYDKSLWELEESSYTPGSFSLLLNEDNKCRISSFGTPDGGDITVQDSKKQLLGEKYSVTTWSGAGRPWLLNVGRDRDVQMSVFLGEDADVCQKLFWDVIELSQKDNFGLGSAKESSLEPVDIGGGFTLFVDPQLWEIEKKPGHNYLVSKTMRTCQIKYQFAHGMDFRRFQPEIGQKQFGNMTFETKRWYPVDNPSETILYGYYSGDIYISIEDSVASPIADECITQVDDILRLSAEKYFKKD